MAGRTQTSTEGLIGLFVNTLPLRTRLSGDLSVRDLLSRVRGVTLGAYAHQALPFEKLVDALAPTRDLTRSPLFQVMLAMQPAPVSLQRLGELTLQPVEVETTTAKFDLTLSLSETADGLRGSLSTAPICLTPPRSSACWDTTSRCWPAWWRSPAGASRSCRC